MPRHERLVRELERATATPNLAPEEDLSLIDEESLLSNGPGRSAMEGEIDELLAGGHFGDIPSIPEEVQETTDNGLQVARGSQRHLLVENGAMTEMELLSNFDEVIWFYTPYGSRYCSASRLDDNLYLTAAHCLFKYPGKDLRNNTAVQSACVHPKWKEAYYHPIAGATFYFYEYDVGVMKLADPDLWQGGTVTLSDSCPQNRGDTQRLIGWGDTGKFNSTGCIYPEEPHPVQRSGMTTFEFMQSDAIRTSRNTDLANLSKNKSGQCAGDSGGFLGYLDEDSGQLSQAGVVSMRGATNDRYAAVCGNSYRGDWVRNVSHSDWASNPNCRYLKYQEPLGPYGPMDMPLHGPVNEGRREGKRELLSLQLPDEARQESFGSSMQSSNRGLGMTGMGLIIGIPLLLLILYLMNKFSRAKNTDKAQSEQN